MEENKSVLDLRTRFTSRSASHVNIIKNPEIL